MRSSHTLVSWGAALSLGSSDPMAESLVARCDAKAHEICAIESHYQSYK